MNISLEKYNAILRDKSPDEIIDWALSLTEERIVTTSFGVYSAVLLSTFHRKDPNIKVVWVDTLFNNDETYEHASNIIKRFNLNIHRYAPLQNKSYIRATIGVPNMDDPQHAVFSEMVKIEPFKRAFKELQPKLWFTNIRVRQNSYRDSKDILSLSKDGILKVSPFYYWSDEELDSYIAENNLPKNSTYYDPTKVLSHRECGIHFQ